MNYKISSISLFDKQAKRLTKKFPSLKNDLAKLAEKLTTEPEQGKALGNNFYKVSPPAKEKGNPVAHGLLPI